jgi:hypothetical protein
MRKEIPGLIEETMSQSGSYQNTQEAVHEHRFELLLGNLLLTIQAMHQPIDGQQTDAPAYRVPSDGKEAKIQCYHIRVPVDE